MKILVIGGAGYIGSVMVRSLMSRGISPIVLDDLSTGNFASLPKNIRFYEGDMADKTLLASIFKADNIGTVMLFAAKVQVGESMKKPADYFDANVAKPVAMLEEMMKAGCKNIIFSSTAATYGNPNYLPMDEKHPTNPINPYGASKLMTERILQDYGMAYGLNSISFRYFNAAGASINGEVGESQSKKHNLIPIILENIEKEKTTMVFGNDWHTADGSCLRDYVHVDDIVDAHILGVQWLKENGGTHIFNLGSGKAASVFEVINAIQTLTKTELDVQVAKRRDGDPAELISSSEKANRVLGWVAKNSDLATITKSAYDWHFNRKF